MNVESALKIPTVHRWCATFNHLPVPNERRPTHCQVSLLHVVNRKPYKLRHAKFVQLQQLFVEPLYCCSIIFDLSTHRWIQFHDITEVDERHNSLYFVLALRVVRRFCELQLQVYTHLHSVATRRNIRHSHWTNCILYVRLYCRKLAVATHLQSGLKCWLMDSCWSASWQRRFTPTRLRRKKIDVAVYWTVSSIGFRWRRLRMPYVFIAMERQFDNLWNNLSICVTVQFFAFSCQIVDREAQLTTQPSHVGMHACSLSLLVHLTVTRHWLMKSRGWWRRSVRRNTGNNYLFQNGVKTLYKLDYLCSKKPDHEEDVKFLRYHTVFAGPHQVKKCFQLFVITIETSQFTLGGLSFIIYLLISFSERIMIEETVKFNYFFEMLTRSGVSLNWFNEIEF